MAKRKEELIDKIELSTYELLANLNKLISKCEKELQTYFFDNVDERQLTGEVEITLIYDPNSEFAKIREEIHYLESQIYFINKKINNPKYFIGRIIDNIHYRKLGKTEKKEYMDNAISEEIERLEKEKQSYETKIRLIKENPKMYVRFIEFKKSDFSSIENEIVRANLENKRRQLELYKDFRQNILYSVKRKNENIKKYVYNKKSNKVIDND